jgi:nitrite reductase/ring-hydroxylating ferredoxin subunit
MAQLDAKGARGFTVAGGDWPLRGLVVRCGDCVRGCLNRCPHAGHPLDLMPGRFLTADGRFIRCSSHGALFERGRGTVSECRTLTDADSC